MKRTDPRFVVCIKNRGYAASLELRKLYRTKPDDGAEKIGMVRVIDESGEDYLYPKEYFLPVHLPQTTQKAVLRASSLR
jgi:hypothetical protein